MLSRLINKKNLIILGLNSGTSADSLDLAVVKISGENNARLLEGKTVRLPKALKEKIFELADHKIPAIDELIFLDNLLGKFFGRSACKYLEELKQKKISVDLIASHGQTIRHLPQKTKFIGHLINGTKQLGSPEFISAQTEKVVVADFRQADIALGNEGAPITTSALKILLGEKSSAQLIVNIGGMSNFFHLPKNKKYKIASADCGPGNVLTDLLAKKLFDKSYDKNGAYARKGIVSERLLTILMAHPFFKEKTISTGRETFGEKMADQIISYKKKLKLTNYDLIATAGALTVRSICASLKPILAKDKEINKLCLTGGGRKNIFFKSVLKASLAPLEICLIDDLGIDGDYTEAACYAIMGGATINSQPLETVENKKQKPILGRIVQPPR